MPLNLAIVGRPNVGKSRLFNRLAGRAAAIVHDTPGVTRDRQAVEAVFDGLSLCLIDTAGFEDAATGSVAHRMTKQTLTAIAEAEALLFVVDARAGDCGEPCHFRTSADPAAGGSTARPDRVACPSPSA